MNSLLPSSSSSSSFCSPPTSEVGSSGIADVGASDVCAGIDSLGSSSFPLTPCPRLSSVSIRQLSDRRLLPPARCISRPPSGPSKGANGSPTGVGFPIATATFLSAIIRFNVPGSITVFEALTSRRFGQFLGACMERLPFLLMHLLVQGAKGIVQNGCEPEIFSRGQFGMFTEGLPLATRLLSKVTLQ